MESNSEKPVSNIPKYGIGWFLFLASFFESQFYENEWHSLMRTLIKDSYFETQLVFTLLNFAPGVIGIFGIALIIDATGFNIFKRKVDE